MQVKHLLNTTLFTLGASLISSSVMANELDLRLSNDWVNVNYAVNASNEKSSFGMGYFYKDDDESINVANIDLHAKGQTAVGNLPTTIGIGFQGTYVKAGDFKSSALPIGAVVRVNLPDAPGVSIESAIHYAPNVLAFGDSDEFRRFRTQLNYRIIENADVSFGYQYINIGIEDANTNETLESGAYLGFKLNL